MTELLFSGGTPAEDGEYENTDEGLVLRIKDAFKLSSDHSNDWRKATRFAYNFVAGEQLEEEDKQKLREQLRPEVAFNRTGAVIDAVEGSEINNRQETRYIPREIGDTGVNEVLTGAADWVRDLCDAEDEETEAFKDMAICGMGWTETRMNYEEDLDGRIDIGRIDPMEMFWDPDSKKQNLADGRWLMRVKEVDNKDGKALWPDKWPEVIEKGPWDRPTREDMGVETNANEPDEYASQDPIEWAHRRRKGARRVVEFQWWEREPVYRVASGERVVEFSQTKFGRLKEQIQNAGIKYVRQTKRRFFRAFVSGMTVLEKTEGPCKYDFSYQCLTGKRNRNSQTWYGLVQQMKDPQVWANKFLMQIMHIINTNSKGGVLYEAEAVENPRKFEEDWAKSDSAIQVADGAIRQKKIQEKPKLDYPAGLDRLMEFAVSSIYQVPGINLEMMGLADRNQPGILEYQRRQSGLTVLAGMFNSLRRYRKRQGRVLLFFIQEYISDGRLVRIVGEKGQQYVPLVKDDETKVYDVIVDESPNSPNQKEKTFQILTQMMPTIAKMGLPMPPELLDYSPLPQSLVEKWKEMLGTGNGEQQQEQMQQLQQQLTQVLEENQQLKAGEAEKMAKLAVERMVAESKLLIAQEESRSNLALKAFETQGNLEIKRMQAKGTA